MAADRPPPPEPAEREPLRMALHEAGAPRTAASLTERETARFAQLFHAMLARGVYLPPSAYEACFLSLAHSSADQRPKSRQSARSTPRLRGSWCGRGRCH